MKILDYQNNLGESCNYKVISNIFKYYGLDIPEEFIYLLFKTTFIKDNKIHIHSISENTFNSIGGKINICKFNSINEFQKQIELFIEKNEILLINTNPQYLSFFQINYNLHIDNSHCCVIYGICEDGIYVADNYVPTYPPKIFNGKVDLIEIYNAVQNSKDYDKIFTFDIQNIKDINLIDIYIEHYNMLAEKIIKDNLKRKYKEEQNNIFFKNVMKEEKRFDDIGYDFVKKVVEETRIEWMSLDGPVLSRGYLANIFNKLASMTANKKYKLYAETLFYFKKCWDSLSRGYIKFAITQNVDVFKKCSFNYMQLLIDEIDFFNKSKIIEEKYGCATGKYNKKNNS